MLAIVPQFFATAGFLPSFTTLNMEGLELAAVVVSSVEAD